MDFVRTFIETALSSGANLAKEYPYLSVFLLLAFVTAFAVGTLIITPLFRRTPPHDPRKLSPYECGIPPTGDARERQMVRFFIIAMLFIIFDVETIFLYSWAIVFEKIGLFALVEMILFIVILFIAYIYAWRKGGLKWV